MAHKALMTYQNLLQSIGAPRPIAVDAFSYGRFPGLRVLTFIPTFPMQCISGSMEYRLSAHSCGGSVGFDVKPNQTPHQLPS